MTTDRSAEGAAGAASAFAGAAGESPAPSPPAAVSPPTAAADPPGSPDKSASEEEEGGAAFASAFFSKTPSSSEPLRGWFSTTDVSALRAARSRRTRSASASLIILLSSSALSRARRRSAFASSLCRRRASPTSRRSAAFSLAKTKRSSRFKRVRSFFSSAKRRVCSRHSALRRASKPRFFIRASRLASRSVSLRRFKTSPGSRNSKVSRSSTNFSSASRTFSSFAIAGSSVFPTEEDPLSRLDSLTSASAADPRSWKLHASYAGSVSFGFASNSNETEGAVKPTSRRRVANKPFFFAGDAPEGADSAPVAPEPKGDPYGQTVTSAEIFTKRPRHTRTRAHTLSRRVVARRTTTSRS